MTGTLFGSIIELISRLGYDEMERLVLTIQNMQSNSTQGNAKLISELREKKFSEGCSPATASVILSGVLGASFKILPLWNTRAAGFSTLIWL